MDDIGETALNGQFRFHVNVAITKRILVGGEIDRMIKVKSLINAVKSPSSVD